MRYVAWVIVGMSVMLVSNAQAETREPQLATARAFPIHNGPRTFALAPARMIPLNPRLSVGHAAAGTAPMQTNVSSANAFIPVPTAKVSQVAAAAEPVAEKPIRAGYGHAGAAMGEEEAKQILSLFGGTR